MPLVAPLQPTGGPQSKYTALVLLQRCQYWQLRYPKTSVSLSAIRSHQGNNLAILLLCHLLGEIAY